MSDDFHTRVATDTSPNGVYSTLRRNALTLTRAAGELPEPSPETPIWGVLMETGYDNATVTLVAFSDGTTSLYFSSGGGVIGGHDHESVRLSNAQFINEANRKLQWFKRCQESPVPAEGQTIFYLRTDSGVLTADASENDLGYNRHTLSKLFHAGHDVISQLRIISEA